MIECSRVKEEDMVGITYLLDLDQNWAHGHYQLGKENPMITQRSYNEHDAIWRDWLKMTKKTINKDVNVSYLNIAPSYVVKHNADYGGTLEEYMHHYGVLARCEKIYITKVLYNNPATIVFWSDGTQTRNICPPDTLYNPDTGLAFCMLKKLMGNDEVAKLFNDWELKDYRSDKNHWVELKDIRKAHKKKGKDE